VLAETGCKLFTVMDGNEFDRQFVLAGIWIRLPECLPGKPQRSPAQRASEPDSLFHGRSTKKRYLHLFGIWMGIG
jgi:hypothetical protein